MRMPGYVDKCDKRDVHERRAMTDTLLRLNCLFCLDYRETPMPYLIIYAGPAGTVGTYQRNTMTGVARAFNDACAASFDTHGELQPVAADATARTY